MYRHFSRVSVDVRGFAMGLSSFGPLYWCAYSLIPWIIGLCKELATSGSLGYVSFGTVLMLLLYILSTSAYAAWLERSAASRRVTVQLATETLGFYHGAFDKLLFRATVADAIYEVVPDTVDMPSNGDFSAAKVRYRFEPLSKDFNESILAKSEAPQVALEFPKFACEIGIENVDRTVSIVGMGMRAGNYLVTARHIFHSPGKLAYKASHCILRNDGLSARVSLDNPVLLTKSCQGATWQDIVAYRIEPGMWAAIKVKSLKTTDVCNFGEGSIEVFGRPHASLMRSRGRIYRDKETEAKRGILSHTANTTETYSGSPVIMMKAGAFKLVGMHVAGGTSFGQVNYAVSHHGLMLMFKKIGFVPTTKQGTVWDRIMGALDEDFSEDPFPSKDESSEKEDTQSEIDWMYWSLDYEELLERPRLMKKEQRDQEDERVKGVRTVWDDLATQAADQEQGTIHGMSAWGGSWADDDSRAAVLESICAKCGFDTSADTPEKLAESLLFKIQELLKGEGLTEKGWIPRELLATCDLSGFSKKKLKDALFALEEAGHIMLVQCRGQAYIMPMDVDSGYQPPPASQEGKPSSPPGLALPAKPVEQPAQEVSAPATKDESRDKYGFKDHSPDLSPVMPVPREEIFHDHLPFGGHENKPGGARFWSNTRSECFERVGTPPMWSNCAEDTDPSSEMGKCCVPQRHMTREECNAFYHWMKTGDWGSLQRFRGVGAQNLLRMAQAAPYKSYLEAGDAVFWKNTEQVRKGNRFNNAKGDVHAFRIGSCARGFQKGKTSKKVSKAFAEHLRGRLWHGRDLGEDVLEYVLPPSGPDAIKESFKAQCERQSPGDWDKLRELPDFGEKMREYCDKYPATQPTTRNTIAALIDTYLDSMDTTKSAGWSARFKSGSKGAWSRLEKDRALLLYLVQMRLALRVAEGDNIHHLPAEEMVRLGLNDPREMFTKLEAHDAKKAKTKRWRLIWVVSMLDSVCQDVLHRAQNKADILAYTAGAMDVQAVGIGHHDEGIRRVGEVFDRMTGGEQWMVCSDASGWDMSVCRDAIYFDAERRISRQTEHHEVFANLMWAEAACNSAHVVVIGTTLWVFEHFGITASGIPSTSAQNSPIRGFTLYVTGAGELVVVGDDEVHVGDVDWVLLASTGVITKGSPSRCGPYGPVEFTSHIYSKDLATGGWTATFNNLAKMLAHLDLRRVEGEAPASDMVNGMRHALRHSPEADEIFCSVCDKMGWSIGQPEDIRWE
jgi:hypothetical protein